MTFQPLTFLFTADFFPRTLLKATTRDGCKPVIGIQSDTKMIILDVKDRVREFNKMKNQ